MTHGMLGARARGNRSMGARGWRQQLPIPLLVAILGAAGCGGDPTEGVIDADESPAELRSEEATWTDSKLGSWTKVLRADTPGADEPVFGLEGRGPLDVERVKRLVADLRASVEANPAMGGVAGPPEARDPGAPATIVYELLEDFDRYLEAPRDSLPRKHARLLASARRDIADALARYGTDVKLGAVVRSLAQSARRLRAVGRRGDVTAPIEHWSAELARAGRGIAERALRRGTIAGVNRVVLARAAKEIAMGQALVLQGRYGTALGHYGGATSLATNALSFDVDRFEQNIQDALMGETIGHAYAISLGGVLYSDEPFGDARTVTDAQMVQSTAKEMYIASISKTLSAIGLLKALDAAGVSVDSSISPYLPSDWVQHGSVGNITFRHLLTHTSGLNPTQMNSGSLSGQTLIALEGFIAAGTPGLLAFNSAVYTNANFALMRVLIPQLTIGDEVIQIYSNILPEDEVYAALYAQYINSEVLSPAQVNVPLCSPAESASNRTLGYLVSMPLGAGLDFGDWSLGCGATGWHLSALELGSVMAFLRYTNDIVDFDTRVLMDSGYLGWLNPVTFAGFVVGDFGPYRAHGGDSSNQPVPGMTGCTMKFPTAVEATVLVNSRGGSFLGGHVCGMLRTAYDNAWTAP